MHHLVIQVWVVSLVTSLSMLSLIVRPATRTPACSRNSSCFTAARCSVIMSLLFSSPGILVEAMLPYCTKVWTHRSCTCSCFARLSPLLRAIAFPTDASTPILISTVSPMSCNKNFNPVACDAAEHSEQNLASAVEVVMADGGADTVSSQSCPEARHALPRPIATREVAVAPGPVASGSFCARCGCIKRNLEMLWSLCQFPCVGSAMPLLTSFTAWRNSGRSKLRNAALIARERQCVPSTAFKPSSSSSDLTLGDVTPGWTACKRPTLSWSERCVGCPGNLFQKIRQTHQCRLRWCRLAL